MTKLIIAVILALFSALGLLPAKESDTIQRSWETIEGIFSSNGEQSKHSAKIGSRYWAKVENVSDGDTLRVLDKNGYKRKIRMSFIDAPEHDQQYGQSAKQALINAVKGKTVEIEVQDIDRYQREVATVYADGININLQQIATGNAWHYVSIAKKQQAKTAFKVYQQAEQDAKAAGLGLWQQTEPTPPWVFRHQKHSS